MSTAGEVGERLGEGGASGLLKEWPAGDEGKMAKCSEHPGPMWSSHQDVRRKIGNGQAGVCTVESRDWRSSRASAVNWSRSDWFGPAKPGFPNQ